MRIVKRRNVWLIGDSLTAGYDAERFVECYRARLAQDVHEALGVPYGTITFNYAAGYGGKVSDAIKAAKGLNGFSPDIVIVQLGENDTSNASFQAEYETLLALVKQYCGNVSFILCGIWDVSGNYGAMDAAIQDAADAVGVSYTFVPLRGYAQDAANIESGRDVSWLNDGNHQTSDSFHPNSRGHAAIAKALLPPLVELCEGKLIRSGIVRFSRIPTGPGGTDTIDGLQAYSTSQTSITVSWGGSDPVRSVEVTLYGLTKYHPVTDPYPASPITFTATAGTQYLFRVTTASGKRQVIRAQTPRESVLTLTGNGRACLGPDGAIYAQIDQNSNKFARSYDGGKTWETLSSGGGKYASFVDRFGTIWQTWESWSGNKNKLTKFTPGGSIEAKLDLRVSQPALDAGNISLFYPNWGMDYGDGILAIAQQNQYNGTPFTSEKANNYVFWSDDYGETWNEIPDFANGNPDRHCHVIRYNEVSGLWFVTTGDSHKKAFRGTFEKGFEEIPELIGGCTGYAPFGKSILWSNDDAHDARIFRTDAWGGSVETVFALPSAYEDSQCFGMGAYPDGEIWATYYKASGDSTVWSSIDGGETWKLEVALNNAQLADLTTFEHSVLNGDFFGVGKRSGNNPLQLLRRWNLR